MNMTESRVVIVEDDPDLLEALVRQFREEGFNVFIAHNGREGVSRVVQVRPDVILLDLLMPEMDGHEMMQTLLAEHDWVREIPVLVMTNYGFGDKPIEDWAKKMRIEYMVKSEWRLQDIVEKVEHVLAASQKTKV